MRHFLHLLAFIAAEAPPQAPPVRVPPQAPPVVREVTTTRTFPRAVTYHAGHDCPTCGRSQFTIYSGSKGRSHSHRCPYDGTIWTH